MDFWSKRNCSVEISSFLRYPSSRFYRSKIWNWGYCPKSWNWGFWMWRFVRQRVLKFAFAWSADFASRYRCELWMYFYQGPVKLGFQFCRICGIVRCSDKSQLALVCSDLFIFLSSAAAEVVFALSWTHKLENIVIHSHSIEPSERGPWVWFFSFDAIPEVSDSQISASCLQDWLSSAFFCRFWHILFFFIQSLGFTLRESWQKFEQRSRWGGPTPIAKRFFYLVRLLEIDADPFSCSWSVRPWSGYWNRSLAHFSWLISVAFSKHLPPRHLYCFILQWHWCLSLLIILSKKCFGSWC